MKTDAAFREELLLHCNSKRITRKDWHPGCTAIAALVIGEKLYVANAGDCRAILNRAGQPFPMSKVMKLFLKLTCFWCTFMFIPAENYETN